MRDHSAIETARLRLVPLAPEHAVDLHRLYADPLAMTYWHTPPHPALSETRDLIDHLIGGSSRAWVLMLQPGAGMAGAGMTGAAGTSPAGEAAGEAIGLVHYLGQARPGDLAMGYILRPDHWRQGLMSEAAGAVLSYGFDTLRMDRAELWIDARNLASQGVARRLGFTRRHVFGLKHPHAARAHETWLYGLEIEQWQAGAAPRDRPPVQIYGIVPVLPAVDVRATVDYYRDVLGFTVDFLAGDPPGYGAVSLSPWSMGPGNIHFKRVKALPPGGSITLRLNVGSGLDELYARYQASGVEIAEQLVTQEWGQRDFTLADCNGHHVCFSAPG